MLQSFWLFGLAGFSLLVGSGQLRCYAFEDKFQSPIKNSMSADNEAKAELTILKERIEKSSTLSWLKPRRISKPD